MSEINVVVEQIFLLLVVGVIGFMAGRFHYLPANSGQVISSLVVRVTAPLMILTKIYRMHFEAEDYLNGIKLYFFAILFILLAYGISILLRKVCRVQGSTAKIFSMQMMFGNVIYFALPLVDVLSHSLPDVWGKGMAYAMFFILGNDTIMWTLGISMISSKEGEDLKTKIKHLFNGNTIAFAIGLFLLLSGLKETMSKVYAIDLFMGKLYDLGQMTALLSMLFIGLMLSKLKIMNIFHNLRKKIYLLVSTFVKLLLLPVLAIVILWLLKGLLPMEPAKVLILQLAMPCGTLIAALAAQYQSDAESAVEGIFLSTILLVVTLPLVLWFSDLLL